MNPFTRYLSMSSSILLGWTKRSICWQDIGGANYDGRFTLEKKTLQKVRYLLLYYIPLSIYIN